MSTKRLDSKDLLKWVESANPLAGPLWDRDIPGDFGSDLELRITTESDNPYIQFECCLFTRAPTGIVRLAAAFLCNPVPHWKYRAGLFTNDIEPLTSFLNL